MLLAALVLAAPLLWTIGELAREAALANLMERGNQALRLHMANIRRELDRYEYLPRLLSTDQRLQGLLADPTDFPRWEAVNRHLAAVSETAGAADIYLMDVSGLTLAHSNWQGPSTFIGDRYAFRPYFRQAMAGGDGRYYALGWRSRERGYYFAHAVPGPDGPLGVVVVKVAIAALEQEPAGAVYDFAVTDPQGVVFLSSRANWRLRSLAPLASSAEETGERYRGADIRPLELAAYQRQAPGAALLTLAGRTPGRYLLQGQTMPEAGWTAHVLTDASVLRRQVINAVAVAGLLLAGTTLALLLLGQRRARRRDRTRYERAAMAAAAAGEARVRAVLDGARVGLLTLDADARVQSMNPTAERLFQQETTAMAGRAFSDLLQLGERAAFLADVTAAAAGGEVAAAERRALRPGGGELPLEIAMSPVAASGGPLVIVTVHDLTERNRQARELQEAHDDLERRVASRTADLVAANRRLRREIEEHQRTETELHRTRDELVQAAKLAAIGQLAAGINHELNQPLTAIRFFADNSRALLSAGRHEEVRGNLEHISSLTERMARIARQLKLFSRRSSGAPVPVSLRGVVDGCLALLAPRLADGRVELVTRLPEEDPYCLGDVVRLEQVLVNLVGNALQAVEGVSEPLVKLQATRLGDRVRITVRDNGPGIAAPHLAQIFDPFFTTKEAGQGLGLGLTISQRIVEELHGTMRAENAPQGGAVFTVELPAVPSEEEAHAGAAGPVHR